MIELTKPDKARNEAETQSYEVMVTEMFQRNITVYAGNAAEAKEKAREVYELGEVEFNYDMDCTGIEFDII